MLFSLLSLINLIVCSLFSVSLFFHLFVCDHFSLFFVRQIQYIASRRQPRRKRHCVHKCPYQGCIKVYTKFYVVWIAKVAAISQRAEGYFIPF